MLLRTIGVLNQCNSAEGVDLRRRSTYHAPFGGESHMETKVRQPISGLEKSFQCYDCSGLCIGKGVVMVFEVEAAVGRYGVELMI